MADMKIDNIKKALSEYDEAEAQIKAKYPAPLSEAKRLELYGEEACLGQHIIEGIRQIISN